MSAPERGSDHAARIASLRAFETSINRGIEAGLAELGTLDDPTRVYGALQLLVQNDRFQDAVDLTQSLDKHCRWVDLAVYAHVTLKDIDSARALLAFAGESCDAAWISDRCRIAVADAVFSEVLDDTACIGLVGRLGLSDEDRDLLEFAIEALSPLVEHVRLSGRVDGAAQRAAVEFAVNAYGLLGELSQIANLVRPMIGCHPVPLLLAQLTLLKICEPPKGLPGRLRIEHPDSFSAQFLAALLDREIYGRKREALDALINLQDQARGEGQEAVEQLCQALFESASGIDVAALAQGRDLVDTLLGQGNRYRLYFDTVAMLHEERADAALAMLDSQPRKEDPIWWQVAARAHELANQLDKASECWNRACELMPHPDMLNRFAGLSIQQRRFDDAVRALKTALAQSPDDPRILEQLAFAYTRLRRFSDATGLFERLVHLQPGVTRYQINLAICEARSGDPNSALKSLDAVVDSSLPNLEIIGVRTEILKSLDRAAEAFADLERLREAFWSDARFLVLYMDTAYRAGQDDAGNVAFHQLMTLQHSGELPEPLFHAMSLDDLKRIGSDRIRRRDSLFSEIVKGKLPWLVAEALLGAVAEQAWHNRTQRLRWLPDGLPSRGEWTVYATNGFSVRKSSDGSATLSRIDPPRPGQPVVVDMSALITMHRLGRLDHAAKYFGKLILPASYGDLPVHDAQRLTQHQPSREEELRTLRDFVERRLITVIEQSDSDESVPLVNEYRDDQEDNHFSLADLEQLLRTTGRVTSQELDELARICHRPLHHDRELPHDSRVVFAASTLRTLVRYEWFERVLATVDWCVARDDYEKEVVELQAYEVQRMIYSAHQNMWQEITQLRAVGKLEFQDSKSARRDRDEDSEADDPEPPPYLDAVLLAHDTGSRLLADDRMCQAAVLNQRPDSPDAAFGTDLLLIALETSGVLTPSEVSNDFLQLIRWRYRFLLLGPQHLKSVALRSRDNLPGPELREIAAYVQESMRDPGLFCGPEKADQPIPVAFKYFMAWKEVCVDFLATLWEDSNFSREQLDVVTRWCIGNLLPAVPRGLLYSPVGRRLAAFAPKAFMLTAMIRFTTVQPLERANEALRVMASLLGMTEDEFYEAAGEAAEGQLQRRRN